MAVPLLAVPQSAAPDSAGATGAAQGRAPKARDRGELRLNIEWKGVPLRRAMAGFSRSAGVAVHIDRRVDPERPVTLAVEGIAPEALLERLAEDLHLSQGRVGSVAYLGPAGAAAKLKRTIAQRTTEARRLPAASARLWSGRADMKWDDLATPGELVSDLARDASIEVQGLDLVPHDLWAAAELPKLALVERLSLVLAGFDLTWRFGADGRRIEIVPLPEEPASHRAVSAPRHGRDALTMRSCASTACGGACRS